MQETGVNFMEVIKQEMVTVTLPKDIWAEVNVMIAGGVFDVSYGRVTLNYAEGRIATISVEKRTFDRKDIPKARVAPP